MATRRLVEIEQERTKEVLAAHPHQLFVEFTFGGITYRGQIIAVNGSHAIVKCESGNGREPIPIFWSLAICFSGKVFYKE